MAGQLTSTSAVPPSSLIYGLPADIIDVFRAGPASQGAAPREDGVDGSIDGSLEPGEVPASGIKQETCRDNAICAAPDRSAGSSEPDGRNVSHSPLAHVAITGSPAVPHGQSEYQGAANDMSRLTVTATATIRRRNHARLSEIVARLQNFNGSVTELLAIASVQQQLDTAFADLDRAKNQLKDVFRQFELQGHISNRQCHKKNAATKDLTKASQRIAQLTKELYNLQRREC